MQIIIYKVYMEFAIILLLLVLNDIFAMYEIALISLSKTHLSLADQGNKSAKEY